MEKGFGKASFEYLFFASAFLYWQKKISYSRNAKKKDMKRRE